MTGYKRGRKATRYTFNTGIPIGRVGSVELIAKQKILINVRGRSDNDAYGPCSDPINSLVISDFLLIRLMMSNTLQSQLTDKHKLRTLLHCCEIGRLSDREGSVRRLKSPGTPNTDCRTVESWIKEKKVIDSPQRPPEQDDRGGIQRWS